MRLARLLLRTDLCLMSQSIEGRVPYLHNGIPELALSLPWAGLVAGAGKTALREAYRRRLGPRAEVRKVRFKASDALLLAALRALAVEGRILDGVAPVFGRLRARAALDLLATPDGFDPDLCCLLLSLAWLA